MTNLNLSTSVVALTRVYLFEKEKGGVGSTGTLATVAHMLLQRGTPVQFIEASLSQLDILNAYKDHHIVHELTLTDADASDKLIDIVASAPPGTALLANIPGGRIEEMDLVHQIVSLATESSAINAQVFVVWTMGLDAASRITLDAMLAGNPPGPILLNLPQWAGEAEKFKNVDEPLLTSIEDGGGRVFVTPAMPSHLYDMFRSEEVATDRIATRAGTTLGNQIALRLWERKVCEALGDIF